MQRMSEEAVGAPADTGHQLLLELGQGGTAQVFLAMLSGPKEGAELVVLKFLKPLLAERPDLRQMFVSEACLAARLNHANIVQSSGILETATGPAIMMEYLEGQSVTAILARSRDSIPLSLHLRIIVDALRGLHYAHDLMDLNGQPLNVVHRDVSPQNVFVTYDGQVKLIDFGIAKLIGSGVETAIGVIKGKIRYMPPEQLEGRSIDRRADIYAAGVMLWEAATRERMWKGQSEVTMIRQGLSGNVPKPRDTNPEVPEELERIILKALAFDRAERHATAADLVADLEAFLDTMPPVTSRDISMFVSGLFKEIRAETQRIVELHLKQRASASRPMSTTSDSISAMPLAAPVLKHALARAGYSATLPADSMSASDPSDSIAHMHPKRRSTSFVAVLLAALAAAILGVRAFTQFTMGPLAARNPARADAAQLRAEPRAAAEASATHAEPAPSPSVIEETAPPPQIASADPPQAARATSDAGGPNTMSASQPSATAARRWRLPPPPSPTSAAAADVQQKPVCDPPYRIDDSGIKRFKIECL